jgi:hypothetical protein
VDAQVADADGTHALGRWVVRSGHDVDVVLAADERGHPRRHRHCAAARRQVDELTSDVGADPVAEGGRVGMAAGEHPLQQRVVTSVKIADHDPEVALFDRLDAGRRDLQIGGGVDGERPRFTVVGEGRCRPLCDRRVVAGIEEGGPAPLELSRLASEVSGEPEGSARQLAQHRGERPGSVRVGDPLEALPTCGIGDATPPTRARE